MDYKNIKIDIQDCTATLIFNRPAVLNALNIATLKEIKAAVMDFEKRPTVKVIILTGEGKAFIAGADIAEMQGMNPSEALQFSELGHDLMHTLQHIKKPVIAAINGFALGGGFELALSCDILLVSDKAKLGLPEVNLGVIQGFGGTQRLPRFIGAARAKELIFTGAIIEAKRAFEIGLANRLVPHEELMQVTLEIARKIGEKSPRAISVVKRVINAGLETNLQQGCQLEIEAFAGCFNTDDQREGMQAFLEKRKPQFTAE